MLRCRGGEFALFTPPAQPTVGLEINVAPDGKGRLWVGSVGNGVLAFESDEFKRPFPSDDIGRVARAVGNWNVGAFLGTSMLNRMQDMANATARRGHNLLPSIYAPIGFAAKPIQFITAQVWNILKIHPS